MDKTFRAAVEGLEPKLRLLMAMEPITRRKDIPSGEAISGVYLFSDGDTHLYVGRSKRIRDRYADHTRPSADMNDAPFAVLLARDKLGLRRAYRGEFTRARLKDEPRFSDAFQRAKEYILTLSFRYVKESDPLCQTLLECYVAIALKARHNSFETH